MMLSGWKIVTGGREPVILEVRCALALGISLVCVGIGGPVSADETPTPVPRKALSDFAASHPARSGGGRIQITNEVVDSIAGRPSTLPAAPVTMELPDEEQAGGKPKAFWVGRYVELRDDIARTRKELEDVEGRIPGLWDSFYHEDDPDRRESVLRPDLEAELLRRRDLDRRLRMLEEKMEAFKVEARKAGALPGWFRDIGKEQ